MSGHHFGRPYSNRLHFPLTVFGHAPCRPIYFCLRFMETLKMNVVAETCTALIKKFLADPYVPKPKSCVFTAWHSQPYSRGSYTSIGVGGQQSHIEKMAEPLFQKPMNRTVNQARVCKCREAPRQASVANKLCFPARRCVRRGTLSSVILQHRSRSLPLWTLGRAVHAECGGQIERGRRRRGRL